MTRNQKRLLKAVVGFVGFFVVLYSTGSLEQDLIGFKQYIIQTLIGLALMNHATKF